MDIPRNFSGFLRKYASLLPSPRLLKEALGATLLSFGMELPIERVRLEGKVLHVLAGSPVKHYLLTHKKEVLKALHTKIQTEVVDIR